MLLYDNPGRLSCESLAAFSPTVSGAGIHISYVLSSSKDHHMNT